MRALGQVQASQLEDKRRHPVTAGRALPPRPERRSPGDGHFHEESFDADGGTPERVKNGCIAFVDGKAGEPVGIMRHIGQRPIFAAGNPDGDFAMLEWVRSGTGPAIGMRVHRTDADREVACDRAGHVGVLNRGLEEAEARGWLLFDMAADWGRVFGGQEAETVPGRVRE